VHETHEAAARALRNAQTETEQVRAGVRRAAPAPKAFQELATYWLEHRTTEKRSAKDDRSILNTHLLPAFKSTALHELRVAEIDAYKATKRTLSPKTLRNHLTLLAAMLRLAVELGWLHSLPSIKKPRIEASEETDQRWLTEAERGRLLGAARDAIDPENPHSEVPFVLYSTALLTGMRAGELAGLRWSDVDFERRSICVARSYDGKPKTAASRRYVPIVDALLPTLRAWKLRCPISSEHLVFPNAANRMHEPSARVFQETLHDTLDRAGFERPTRGRNVHVIHFHSLRHTFACHWRLNGGPIDELVRVLGHTSRAMTEHYANFGSYHKPAHFRLLGEAPPVAAPSTETRTG
jgi:integrase